jgi:chromate transporter
VAQQAVQNYGWLQPGEMLDGLGMAETTPGPLIMVVQFVGFMGAYRDHSSSDPMLAATLAAVLTTWVTFIPCFLWIFLGAPFIETLRNNVALTGAMSAVTAAVVGVIMNLAIWFALHVLFRDVIQWQGYGMALDVPVWHLVDVPAAVLTFAAVLATFWFKTGMLPTLLACSLAGVLWHMSAGVL